MIMLMAQATRSKEVVGKPERDPIVVNINKEYIPIIEHISKQTKRDKDDVFNSLLYAGLNSLGESLKLIIEKRRKENINGE